MALSPEIVHARLRAIARRLRWLRCARGVLSGAAGGAAMLCVLLLADAQFHFGPAVRWTAFALVAAPMLAGLAGGLWTARRRVSESGVARRIETAAEGSGNALISAVQFDRELAPGAPLREALFQEMRNPFPRVNWGLVFDLPLLRRIALILGGALAVLALIALARPLVFANSAARILLPGRAIAPLTHTRIAELTPGNTRVVNGRELTVSARLDGQIPRGVWLETRAPGGGWQKRLMDHEIGSAVFTCAWSEVREPFAYRVAAGDAISPVCQIDVRPRTALVRRAALLTPPAYTRLEPETRRDFAALQGVTPGSRVAFTLEFNNPLEELRCDAPDFTVQKVSPTAWTLGGVLKANATLRLDFRDTDGVADSESLPVAVAPDEPPRVTVTTPPEGKETFAAPTDALAVTFTATDNFGLESAALYRTSDETQEAEQIALWKEAAGRKSFSATLKVPLARYARDGRVTLALVAKDQNNVTGPGVTWSRPLVVTLRSQEQLQAQQEKAAQTAAASMDALVKLQQTNLALTQNALAAGRDPAAPQPPLPPLLERQAQIADTGRTLAATAAPDVRALLQPLADKELPAAVLALRNAAAATAPEPRIEALGQAIALEAAILARLQGARQAAAAEAVKGKIQDLLSTVEELLRNERLLFRDTNRAAKGEAKPLAERQDALAEKTAGVRKSLEKSARDASVGDEEFRARLTKAAGMFQEFTLYEKMLAAAEHLQSAAYPLAAGEEKEAIAGLAKIVEMLNQWQLAEAQREAESLKQAAKAMADKLEALAKLQRDVVEKSKEAARKADMRPQDAATAEAMRKAKEQEEKAVEQMLTDAHLFPDIKPANELRGELTQIYEDVIQADKAEAEAGTLKVNEVAVQKEDSLLKAIEQAQKVAEDLEMWLSNTNDTTKWLCENFDKSEMPDMPNLPLPDAFEDLVGDLLTEQEGLAQEAMDAASNQALAQAQQGWGVADGPMPGFSAQGKSGNTRPNKNEQNGRSSGGREGMSNGEMVGDTASNLEGTTPDTRRTNDPMQQGQIKDNGGIQQARATGGGKAGGFSDRNGMDGNAPVRPSNAPRMAAADALAVQQALLSEKTSKTYSQATLLYLRAGGLPGVARLMDQSQAALKEGRLDDFRSLHQKIVTQLREVQGGVLPGNVMTLSSGDAPRAQEKRLLGGDEGEAPPAYQKAVEEYYRTLQP
ncbi:MAG: hypothetical protein PHQ12_07765 [Chthoniobacteraceae bacterium]|nr:hypothetical protein [Chthoniobacteraceae bacterium]